MSLRSPSIGRRVRHLAQAVFTEAGHPDLPPEAGEAAGAMLVLPMFAWRGRDAQRGDLGAAFKVGWRAFWLGESAGAVLDLSITPGGRPRAHCLSFGAKSAQMARALERAAASRQGQSEISRPALLWVPHLHWEALWLRGGREQEQRLFSLEEGADDAALRESLTARLAAAADRP
jgi:hypothetical protein